MNRPKYTKYYERKNMEKIAESLDFICYALTYLNNNIVSYMDDFNWKTDRYRSEQKRELKSMTRGISSICKNLYNENIRIEHLIDSVERLAPADID